MTGTDDAEPDAVVVRRTGGLAGTGRTGRLELGTDGRGAQARALLDRIDLPAVAADRRPTQPDRFVYSISANGVDATVPESQLTGDLGDLVKLVFDEPR